MKHGTAALAAALLFGACTAWAGQTWRLYTYVPNANLQVGKGLARMAQRITQETDGAINVQVNWGGSLPIKATDITQAVGDDIVQMAGDGFYAQTVPLASLLRMPLLVTTTAEYNQAWPLVKDDVEAAFAKVGVGVLGYYLYQSVTVFANRPVTKAADLSGLKIRQSDPISSDILKAYNATPITMGTSDVAPALQQGVVNGAVTTSAGGGRIWGDLLTHNYRMPLYVPEGFVVVNKKRMDALPSTVASIVRKIVAEETARITVANETEERETIAVHRAKGMVVTPASAAEIEEARKRMDATWAKWAGAQGPQAERMLTTVRKRLGR